MISVANEAQELIIGIIKVKLAEIDYDDLADEMHHLGQSQLHHFNQHGELSDLKKSMSNTATAVQLMDDGHLNKPL